MILKNNLLLRVCRGESVERTPVWIMRQAGRYLPEYQAVRSKTDFLTMCRTPELAAEVTLQPVDIIGVDAAIIFSDILVIPEAMGMSLQFTEGRGPVFERPLRDETDIAQLAPVDVQEKLDYVFEALRLTKHELAGRVPLIGFAGAPWTLAAYMIEGSGSKNFVEVKKMMYSRPELLHSLLDKLTRAVADFLRGQIRAGAQVVQLFDSWAGILNPDGFRQFSLPYIERVVAAVAQEGVPVIVFAREAGHSFDRLARIGASALSVSWSEDLAQARSMVGGKVALQGNLDPCALFATPEALKSAVLDVLEKARGGPHIFNLGHGILPETPVSNARALVELVKEHSPGYLNNTQ